MKQPLVFTVLFSSLCLIGCENQKSTESQELTEEHSDSIQYLSAPLVSEIYTADPSAHVFDGKIYIYPSHDRESAVDEDDSGAQYDMKDYHVFSLSAPDGSLTNHGKVLDLSQVPWAKRQLWAPDAAEKAGKYYLYFPAKDHDDIFKIGVAVADNPAGPFEAYPRPIEGTYSMDPAVFEDEDGTYYMYWGGIWGGQLQKWRTGEYLSTGDAPDDDEPADDEPAIAPQVARLSENMVELAEESKDVLILDAEGNPITAGDHDRRFFEAAWLHKYKGRYYFSYSTGDTHKIVYAIGDSPYGPFTYQGVILLPVQGWTNHHSIVEYENQWYIFYHDTELSGKNYLRNIKLAKLTHLEDGRIAQIDPLKAQE